MPERVIYLDASALVKRYVEEAGTEEVQRLLVGAAVLGTAAITQVEVAAALAKAVRMGVLDGESASEALAAFRGDWRSFERLQVTEIVISRAAELAWERSLRAYDATHLAAALIWQELLGESVAMVTFDRELWEAANASGLEVWPQEIP